MAALHRNPRRGHRPQIDRVLLERNRRRRLERQPGDDRRADAHAAEDAAAAVRAQHDLAVHAVKGIVSLGTAHLGQAEPVAELDALHGRDTEERRGQMRLKTGLADIAKPRRHAGRDDLDETADRIAGRTAIRRRRTARVAGKTAAANDPRRDRDAAPRQHLQGDASSNAQGCRHPPRPAATNRPLLS